MKQSAWAAIGIETLNLFEDMVCTAGNFSRFPSVDIGRDQTIERFPITQECNKTYNRS